MTCINRLLKRYYFVLFFYYVCGIPVDWINCDVTVAQTQVTRFVSIGVGSDQEHRGHQVERKGDVESRNRQENKEVPEFSGGQEPQGLFQLHAWGLRRGAVVVFIQILGFVWIWW